MTHPFAPLTAAEIAEAVSIFRGENSDERAVFCSSGLSEPAKTDVRSALPVDRIVKFLGTDSASDGGFEALVKLNEKKVTQMLRLPTDAQAPYGYLDLGMAVQLTKSSEEWLTAVAARVAVDGQGLVKGGRHLVVGHAPVLAVELELELVRVHAVRAHRLERLHAAQGDSGSSSRWFDPPQGEDAMPAGKVPIDPALLVAPPAGLELGFVPVPVYARKRTKHALVAFKAASVSFTTATYFCSRSSSMVGRFTKLSKLSKSLNLATGVVRSRKAR